MHTVSAKHAHTRSRTKFQRVKNKSYRDESRIIRTRVYSYIYRSFHFIIIITFHNGHAYTGIRMRSPTHTHTRDSDLFLLFLSCPHSHEHTQIIMFVWVAVQKENSTVLSISTFFPSSFISKIASLNRRIRVISVSKILSSHSVGHRISVMASVYCLCSFLLFSLSLLSISDYFTDIYESHAAEECRVEMIVVLLRFGFRFLFVICVTLTMRLSCTSLHVACACLCLKGSHIAHRHQAHICSTGR